MEDKQILLKHLHDIHTTVMGVTRIKKNLDLNVDDIVGYCKGQIIDDNCRIHKKGKNYYCENGDELITINSYTFTIITAHRILKKHT